MSSTFIVTCRMPALTMRKNETNTGLILQATQSRVIYLYIKRCVMNYDDDDLAFFIL